MRYLVGFILFLQSFVILAQTSQSKSINHQEKQRLENEFKALGDYYIDDSGLVVYRTGADSTPKNDNTQSNSVNSRPNNINSPAKDNRKPNTVVAPEKKYTEPSNHSNSIRNTPVGNKNTNTSEYIKSDQLSETTPIIVDRTASKVENKENIASDTKTNTSTNSYESKSSGSGATSKSKSGSVLNRSRQPQYKNMEEAALAVEALIEELKKEQTSYTNSGSMSSRLSKGVTKDLRKQSERNIQEIYSPEKSTYQVESSEEATEFGNEPSYFINGVQVDKIEVNKLRKSDIINREIRVRNTVTQNPNGEIWYEVSEVPQ